MTHEADIERVFTQARTLYYEREAKRRQFWRNVKDLTLGALFLLLLALLTAEMCLEAWRGVPPPKPAHARRMLGALKVVGPVGLQPTTSCLEGRCSDATELRPPLHSNAHREARP
jgi:hypothetical protein